ncbi:MAG: lytic murein transglycosylase B, partial [Gammaproteobacteria bacterium]
MQVKYILSLIALCCSFSLQAATYADRPEVQVFIGEMAKKHQFDPDELEDLFAQAEKQQKVIDLMQRPAEGKPWYKYRPIFVTPDSAKKGAEFWRLHNKTLNEVQKRYGVPPQIIVAIIGAETRYGTNTGDFPVFDTLTTLAFDYPRRAPFFRGELEQYLLMTRDEQLPTLSLKGSYAGAMGPPQFMPSSYRAYAVDYDDQGQINLLANMDDAIVSVANYFHRHHWQTGGTVAVRANVEGTSYKKLISTEMREGTNVLKPHKPNIHISELKKYGITPSYPVSGDPKVSLIELENENGKEYWLGFNNFYVITRYNHSNLYAMAVY